MKKLKISKALLLCAISFTLFNCSDSEQVVTKDQNIKGGNDLSENSKVMVNAPFGSGVNIQASFYNSGKNHISYGLMNNYAKIKTVRIEIEIGKVSIATAKKWIQDAQNAGFQVIATYHDVDKLASNSVADLIDAANWWKARYDDLGGDFIINIMNEWGGHSMSSTTYGNAYDDAINIIRTIPGYGSRPIIIDLPGYGQGATVAGNAADLIEDTNFYFSTHIYKNAYNSGANSALTEGALATLLTKHSKLIVGEFGFRQSGPNTVNVKQLLAFCRSRNMPLLGWCWMQDGEGMNMIRSAYSTYPNNVLVSLTVNNEQPYIPNAGVNKNGYFYDIYDELPSNY